MCLKETIEIDAGKRTLNEGNTENIYANNQGFNGKTHVYIEVPSTC